MKFKIDKKNKNKYIILSVLAVIFIIALIVVCIVSANKNTKTNLEEVDRKAEEINNSLVIDLSNEVENIVPVEEFEKVTGTAKYYIRVNYGAQVVNIYEKDEEGNYTVPVKAMICSTGEYTPKEGTYSIPGRWIWGLLQGNVYGQYVTKITGNILFHSVPYTRRDPSSLEYWEYDKLGTDASAGCVRLKVEDAKWIYENCANGTKVEFYSSENPGPLGKPTAMKITDYEDKLRNWDPTDPNPNNPWNGGSGEVTSGSTENNSNNNQNDRPTTNENTTPETNNQTQVTEQTPPTTENTVTNNPTENNTEIPPQAEENNVPNPPVKENTVTNPPAKENSVQNPPTKENTVNPPTVENNTATPSINNKNKNTTD